MEVAHLVTRLEVDDAMFTRKMMAADQRVNNFGKGVSTSGLDGWSRDVGKHFDSIGAQLSKLRTQALSSFTSMASAGSTFGKSVSNISDFFNAERFKNFGQQLSGVGASITSVARDVINATSDLGESQNKANVVFRQSVDEVNKFAQSSASALGLSKQKTLEATATLGNLFTAMKIGRQPAADMSISIVKLASDLASFNNVKPEVALEKLRAGLTGEAEPLKALGVMLNETTMKAQATAMGFKAVGGQFTEQEKVMARYQLILEQTKTAQGDFANTSMGLANASRIAKAHFEDLSAELGARLLPMVNQALNYINGLAQKFHALPESVQSTVMAIAGIGLAAGPVMLVVGKLTTAFASIYSVAAPLISSMGGLSGAFGLLTGPIGIAAAAVAGFAALVINDVGGLRTTLSGILSEIGEIFKKTWAALQDQSTTLGKIWDGVKAIFSSGVQVVGSILNGLFSVYRSVFQLINGHTKEAGETLKAASKQIWDSISGYVQTVMGKLPDILDGVWTLVKAGAKLAWEGLVAYHTQIMPKVVAAVVDFLGELPGKVWPILVDLNQRFVRWGADLLGIAGVETKKVPQLIVEILKTLPGKVFNDVLVPLNQFFNEKLGELAVSVRQLSLKVASAIWDEIKLIPARIGEELDKLPGLFSEKLGLVAGTTARHAKNIATSIIDEIKGIPTKVEEALATAQTTFSKALGWIQGDAETGSKGIFERIKEWIGKIPELFAGMALGAIAAIRDLPGKLFEKAKEMAARFLGGFKEGFSGKSNLNLDEIVSGATGSVAAAIEQAAPKIADATKKLTDDIGDQAKKGIAKTADQIAKELHNMLSKMLGGPEVEKVASQFGEVLGKGMGRSREIVSSLLADINTSFRDGFSKATGIADSELAKLNKTVADQLDKAGFYDAASNAMGNLRRAISDASGPIGDAMNDVIRNGLIKTIYDRIGLSQEAWEQIFKFNPAMANRIKGEVQNTADEMLKIVRTQQAEAVKEAARIQQTYADITQGISNENTKQFVADREKMIASYIKTTLASDKWKQGVKDSFEAVESAHKKLIEKWERGWDEMIKALPSERLKQAIQEIGNIFTADRHALRFELADTIIAQLEKLSEMSGISLEKLAGQFQGELAKAGLSLQEFDQRILESSLAKLDDVWGQPLSRAIQFILVSFNKLTDAAGKANTELLKKFTAVGDLLTALPGKIGKVASDVIGTINSIVNIVSKALNVLDAFGVNLPGPLEKLRDILNNGAQSTTKVMQEMRDKVVEIIGQMSKDVVKLVGDMLTQIKAELNKLPPAGGASASQFSSQFVGGVKGLPDILGGILGGVTAQFGGMSGKIIAAVGLAIKAIESFNRVPVIMNATGFAAVNFANQFENSMNRVGASAQNAATQVNAATSSMSAGMQGALGFLGAGFGSFMTGFGTSNATGSRLTGSIIGGASGALSGAATGAMWGAAGGPIGMLGGAIIGAGIGILGGLLGGGRSELQKAQDALALQQAKDGIKISMQQVLQAIETTKQSILTTTAQARDIIESIRFHTTIGKEPMRQFWADMRRFMKGLAEEAGHWKDFASVEMKKAAENIGAGVDLVAKLPAAFQAISQHLRVPDIQYGIFFDDLDRFWDGLVATVEDWSKKTAKKISKLSTLLAPAVDLISPLTEGMKAMLDIKDVPTASFDVLDRFLDTLTARYGALATKMDKGVLKAIEFLASKVAPVVDLSKSTIDLIKSAVDVKVPSTTDVENIFSSLTAFVNRAALMATGVKTEGLLLVAKIAEVITPMASGLKAWLETSVLAKDYTSISAEVWQNIVADFQRGLSMLHLLLADAALFVDDAKKFDELVKLGNQHLSSGLAGFVSGLQGAASQINGALSNIGGGIVGENLSGLNLNVSHSFATAGAPALPAAFVNSPSRAPVITSSPAVARGNTTSHHYTIHQINLNGQPAPQDIRAQVFAAMDEVMDQAEQDQIGGRRR